MKLELGIVESCDNTGCRVRLLDQTAPCKTRYAAAVQDRIRIRRGDLVAVDLAPELPELVWRWLQVEVLQPLQEAPAAAGQVIVGARGVAAKARIVRPGLELAPGDHAWLAKSERGPEVVDRADDGRPADPEWIRRTWFPLIEAEYAAMVAGD